MPGAWFASFRRAFLFSGHGGLIVIGYRYISLLSLLRDFRLTQQLLARRIEKIRSYKLTESSVLFGNRAVDGCNIGGHFICLEPGGRAKPAR